jgi:hypothetical protein
MIPTRKVPVSLLLGALALSVLAWWPTTPNAHGAADAYITGRVLTRASKPIAAVWVVVSESGTIRGRSLTGDDGRYYVGKLDRKAYDLAVTRGRQTLIRRQVHLPENTTYDIVMPQ